MFGRPPLGRNQKVDDADRAVVNAGRDAEQNHAVLIERVPCAPVLTLHEAMAHPHLRQRGTVRRVREESIGEFDIPGCR